MTLSTSGMVRRRTHRVLHTRDTLTRLVLRLLLSRIHGKCGHEETCDQRRVLGTPTVLANETTIDGTSEEGEGVFCCLLLFLVGFLISLFPFFIYS